MSRLVPLGGKKGKDRFAIVDARDFDWVMQWPWFVMNHGYIARNQPAGRRKQRTVLLHRELAKHWDWNLGDGKQIDHINHDILDNRQKNLRIVDNLRNCQNKSGPYANGTSGFLGVSFVRKSGLWFAHITVNTRMMGLGLFDTPKEAARVRDSASHHFFGEYATLNFPDEEPQPYKPYKPAVLIRSNTSGFRGVHWDARKKEWRAQISHNHRKIWIGAFGSPEEAARAYDVTAKRLHGPLAMLNFPDEDT